MPVMLFFIYLSAKFVVSKMQLTNAGLTRLLSGATALALLLITEFTLVLGLRGMSIDQYLESRDEVAFGAYVVALIIFAIMPLIIGQRKKNGA